MEIKPEANVSQGSINLGYCQCHKQLIRVEGMTEKTICPDNITGRVVVKSTKISPPAAKDSVIKRVDYILATLKTYKLQKEVCMEQCLSRPDPDSELFQFRVDVVFVISSLGFYQDIVNKLTEKLVDYISITEPEFSFSDGLLNNHRLQVSLKAIECSKEKASQIATTLNLKLGPVTSVTEIFFGETDGADQVSTTAGHKAKRPKCDSDTNGSRHNHSLGYKIIQASVTMKSQVCVTFRLL